MPPGTDDLPGKKPPEPKAKRGQGRSPAGSAARRAPHLEWTDHPDDTQNMFPGRGLLVRR